MVAPVTRTHGDGLAPAPSLSAGGRLRRAGTALGGGPFRDGKKLSEPHDRQQGETDLHGRRGKSVEVAQNHAGGTREGLAVLLRRGPRRRGARASDSSIQYDGGAIFGQPQERQSGRQVGPHGSGRDGRVGVKVRRVARAYFRMWRTPVGRTSRTTVPTRLHRRHEHPRSRRGAAKPTAAEPTGDLPPWKAPEDGASGAKPHRRAKAQRRFGHGVVRHARGHSVRGGTRSNPLRP
jgi:hypothetical protein